jgi:hypothetical protein
VFWREFAPLRKTSPGTRPDIETLAQIAYAVIDGPRAMQIVNSRQVA